MDPMQFNPPSQILILGDGNYSFSLTFAKRTFQIKNITDVELVATTFDEYDQLVHKYPEVIHILSEISKHDKVKVIYGIDATKLESNISLVNNKYDCIIFNFPHLGIEDCIRNSSLVAHTMHSVKSVMKSHTSILCIALAESQYYRWNIKEMADRNGYELSYSLPFLSEDWIGYQLKRHHTGKSFQSKVDNLSHYCFRLKHDIKMNTTESNPREDVLSILSKLVKGEEKTIIEPTKTSIINNDKNKNIKGKKRKMHLLTEGMFRKIDNFWICLQCQKQFLSEQGVRTHCYSLHFLQQQPVQEESFRCEDCDKIFDSQDAWTQHLKAKHSSHFFPVTNHDIQSFDHDTIQSQNLQECSVCGMRFDTKEELEQHMSIGTVPRTAEYSLLCEVCNKKFHEERALRQHYNFCKS